MNLLQGWVTKKEGWRRGLDTELPIEPRIRRDFDADFEKRDDLQLKLHELLDTWFHRYRRRWPDEARWGRDELIGELRRLLAAVCIRALEPDLVIMDEFQRFKPLIETREEHRSPAAELAQSLFQTKAHDGRPEDFLATTRFSLDLAAEHRTSFPGAAFPVLLRAPAPGPEMHRQEAQLPSSRHDRDVRAPALKRVTGAQYIQIGIAPIRDAPANGESCRQMAEPRLGLAPAGTASNLRWAP